MFPSGPNIKPRVPSSQLLVFTRLQGLDTLQPDPTVCSLVRAPIPLVACLELNVRVNALTAFPSYTVPSTNHPLSRLSA